MNRVLMSRYVCLLVSLHLSVFVRLSVSLCPCVLVVNNLCPKLWLSSVKTCIFIRRMCMPCCQLLSHAINIREATVGWLYNTEQSWVSREINSIKLSTSKAHYMLTVYNWWEHGFHFSCLIHLSATVFNPITRCALSGRTKSRLLSSWDACNLFFYHKTSRCTGWLKIKYPSRHYANSPQPVARF